MSNWFAINEDLWDTVAGSRPPLFYFFGGFIDSGRTGVTLIGVLLEHPGSQLLGSFDMDLVHNYRARRPVMVSDHDHQASFEEPVLNLHLARDAEGMPYLMMRGPEPDYYWRSFRGGLVGLVQRPDILILLTGYGMPTAFPYTRPTPLAIHTTDPELQQQDPRWIDHLEIPASFFSYLEYHLGKPGTSSYGVAAHVPRCPANAFFTQAVVIILHRYTEATELALPTDELDLVAEANLMAIEVDTRDDETARELLYQFEEQYDRYVGPTGEDLFSVDETAAAVERLLVQCDDGNQPPPKGERGRSLQGRRQEERRMPAEHFASTETIRRGAVDELAAEP